MTSIQEKIIKPKLGLLELAKQLGSVSQACKVMGYSRDSFYRFKDLYEQGGEEALMDLSRRKPILKNRVPEHVEKAVIELAIENPALGQKRASWELQQKGVMVLSSGVRSIWLRNDLETMKKRLKALDLRTRRRTLSSGETRGGGAFDRGHIHHILTNPVYAGRIRHRDKVHDGQHDPIIAPDRWDALQLRLQGKASRLRRRKTPRRVSLLCRKLFDETGDRLTPSHSRTKRGTRLRYYVSHRLVTRSGEENLDGWRLPADQLEAQISTLAHRHLTEPTFAGRVSRQSDASEIARVRSKLTNLTSGPNVKDILALVERITLAPGKIILKLDPKGFAEALDIDVDALDADTLKINEPFQLRKRGVETKIILAETPRNRDEALIRNIALAHHWLERIKAGETFGDIARTDGISKRRVQHMIDLAFLAPDIVRNVLEGKQPLGFTSDWCKARTLPSDWQDQRALLAIL